MTPKPPRGLAKSGREAFHAAHAQLLELDEYEPTRHDADLAVLAQAVSDADDAREQWQRDGRRLTVTANGRVTEHPLRRVERAALRAATDARGRLGLTPARIRRRDRETAAAAAAQPPPPPQMRLYITCTTTGERHYPDDDDA